MKRRQRIDLKQVCFHGQLYGFIQPGLVPGYWLWALGDRTGAAVGEGAAIVAVLRAAGAV